jgi:hypothetical protein
MVRAGVILILVALAIAAVGTVQLPLVVWLSGDATLNPVGNGILAWLSWVIAGILSGLGLALVSLGRARAHRTPRDAS